MIPIKDNYIYIILEQDRKEIYYNYPKNNLICSKTLILTQSNPHKIIQKILGKPYTTHYYKSGQPSSIYHKPFADYRNIILKSS